MKLFRRLDNYLLHYYPSIWITRVHVFLPVGLIITVLLFYGNLAIPWNPKDNFPGPEIPIVMMIIPVLIYLVYWFVFQSRYNVAKSGGRMPIGFEYLNFFLYYLVFFMAFMLISAIPISGYHKVKFHLDEEELKQDILNLNAGNVLVNGTNTITFKDNGWLEYYQSDYVFTWYYDSETDYDYDNDHYITVTRDQALLLIKNYIRSYNKYTHYPISQSAQEILRDREEEARNNSYDYSYYSEDWDVQYKLSALDERIHSGHWYGEYHEPWFWKISLGILAFFALLVWIFKQMKLRHFVFGLIAIVLTPLVAGIVGVILFEVLRIGRHEEEDVASIVVLCVYAIVAFFAIRAWTKNVLNGTGYVMTMYLNFFLPLLPFFLWLYFGLERNYYYAAFYTERALNIVYWSCWIVGLLSILMFKPIYAKFGSLPSKT